jgi:thioredoxin reductase (NADPH)
LNSAAQHARLIILGSGPAGCTAALYAARANLNPALIAGFAQGGQLMSTTDVDNWPADVNGVQGPELMMRFIDHAQRFGTRLVKDQIRTVDLQRRPFLLQSDTTAYTCDALIVATGASAVYLGLPSERAFLGHGVSGCATCDGFFYKDEDVCVVGGGNAAVEEALYLTNIARHVTVIHRRGKLRAEAILRDRLAAAETAGRVTMLWNTVLDEVLGDKDVSGVRVLHLPSGRKSKLPVKGVFIAIGHRPNTEIFAGQLEMSNGYILTRGGSELAATSTSVAGVFAAGDVQDHVYRQAVTSAGTGCMAALDAEKYLAALPHSIEVTEHSHHASELAS